MDALQRKYVDLRADFSEIAAWAHKLRLSFARPVLHRLHEVKGTS